MMKAMIAVMAAAFAVSLTGCNTMAGAGRDIERGGQKLTDAAYKVRADWRAARDRNDREYETARTSCTTGTDAQRDACRERARNAYLARMNEARGTYHRHDLRAQSEEDRREEAYEVARDRCDTLRGADEDRCIADARRQFGRS
jgi:predicted small secreted protein